MPIPRAFLAVLAVLAVPAPPVLAQPPEGPPVRVERRTAVLEGGALARAVTRWGVDEETSGASLTIGEAAPTILARGTSAVALERGERVALVAYETFGRGSPFHVRVIRRENGHDVLGDERALARPGGRSLDSPFAVAVAPIPERGFAVFFEELQSDDPSAARTYLFLFDRDGAPLDAGHEVPIPWPIGAAAWNGGGYHLALLYPGDGNGMRLSMVSLTTDGHPQQHPDWSSGAGYIGDVHLVVRDAHLVAHYRGGQGGDRWLEGDVTAIRSWGSDPPRARDHGAFDLDATLVVEADGSVRRVEPRDDGLSATR